MRRRHRPNARDLVVLTPRPGMGGDYFLKELTTARWDVPHFPVDELLSPGSVRAIEGQVKTAHELGFLVRRVRLFEPDFRKVMAKAIERVMSSSNVMVAFLPTVCGYPLQPQVREAITVERYRPEGGHVAH